MLTRQIFDQVSEQINSVNSLKYSYRRSENPVHIRQLEVNVPGIIFAYDSRVKRERVVEGFEKVDNLLGVCIIGKYALLRSGPQKAVVVEPKKEVCRSIRVRTTRELETADRICDNQVTGNPWR